MPQPTHEHIISEQWRDLGIERLLTSPPDVVPPQTPPFPALGSRRPEAHARAFDEYIRDLQTVVPEAKRVWLAVIRQFQASFPDRAVAMKEALRFQPAGAAFDARVIAVVRRHWLVCDRLNRSVTESDRVAPERFLLEWLIAAGQDDPVDVLAGMPYWPIGLDADGNWI